MEIKSGDLLFVWGSSLMNKGIEFVTHGSSHVAMFINSHTLCEAQGGRGVGESNLSAYTNSGDYLEIWRDNTLAEEELNKMIQFAKSQYGKKYDYILIPLEFFHYEFGLPLDWYKEHGKYICSTYINAIGNSVGRKWSKVMNPAPKDDENEDQLQKLYSWDGVTWNVMKSKCKIEGEMRND